MAMNPKAGSASVPSDANTPRGNITFDSPKSGGGYRSIDGKVVGGLDSNFRVKGSEAECDPRDPKGGQVHRG